MLRSTVLVAALAAATAGVVGCSDSQEPAKPATTAQRAAASAAPRQPQRILDRFSVGDNVYVRALAVEPGGNALWVGTSAGVHEVDLANFDIRNTFTRDDGLANEYVFAVGLDHEGYKWFGTNAGGVSKYKDGQWQTIFPMHGLADYWVYSFASQRDGTFWIGTWAGANKVDPESGELTTYVRELINEWVYGLAVDSKDRVWFGTEGGVSMFDGEKWTAWNHDAGLGAFNSTDLPASRNTGLGTRSRHDLGVMSGGQATYNPNYCFSVHIDPSDTVWVGTWGGGVARFDGNRWTNLTMNDGLAGNIVYAVTQDQDGVFWFGTNGGISRYDGETWHNYGPAEGLTDLNIYTLAVAPNGDIWAGTRGAVIRIGR